MVGKLVSRKLAFVAVLVLLVPLLAAQCAPAAPGTTQPAAPQATAGSGQAQPAEAKPAAGSAKEVVVGAIYPMTGASAQIGQDAKAAIDLAVEIVNGKYDLALPLAKEEGLPNLGGAKVRVVYGDHQGSPEKGQSEAERLITQEKTVALVGTYHSSVAAAASQVAEREGVPFLVPESSSPTLHTRGLKYFFRTTPHDLTFSEAMFKFMAEWQQKNNKQIKTLALFHEDTLFGSDSAKAWQDLAKANNMQVVEDVKYTQNSTSLSSEVLRLKAANADVILAASLPSDAILFVKTLKELNYVPPMLIAQDAGYVEPNFITSSGKDADGFISRAVWSLDLAAKKPIVAEVNKLYKAKTGKDLADNSAREFTGMMVLLDAINRAGSTDPKAIRDALAATNLTSDQIIMPWAGVKFDPATGQNTLSQAMMIQLQGGTYKTIWPADTATSEMVYPITPFDKR